MKKIFLTVVVALFLASCKDDKSGDSVSQQDYGLEDATRNLPVGWIYVEYPTFYDGSVNIDPPNPCNLGYMDDFTSEWKNQSLSGTWATIDHYNGRFFRAESYNGGRARTFVGDTKAEGGNALPSNSQPLQDDALQAHRHGVGAIRNDKTYNDGGYPAPLIGIDETSYGNAGGRTLEYNVASTVDLTDNFTNGTTGETNSAPRMDVETRPENYTMRMWRKVANNSSATDCVVAKNVESIQYKDVMKTIKDRDGKIISMETIKKIISKKAVYDANGNAEYRIIGGNADAKIVPTRGVKITNAPDIEINVGKEEVVEIK